MAHEDIQDRAAPEPHEDAPASPDAAVAAMNEGAEAASPVLIVADSREPRELLDAIADRGVPVERRQISPADFVVGPIAIERKNIQDSDGSLLRKRLAVPPAPSKVA